MFMNRIISLTIIFVGCNAALTDLDSHNLQELDKYVRTKLVNIVVARLNDSIDAQKKSFDDCEKKINLTAEKCTDCRSHLPPAQQPQQPGDPLSVALPLLLQTGIKSGEFLKLMANTVASPQAIKLLGKGVTKVVSDLGSVSKNAGNFLLDGAKSALSSSLGAIGDKMSDLTKDLGKSLEGAAGSLGHLVTGTIGNGLENIGSGLVHGAENVVNQLAHGATDVANHLAHGATDVVNNVVDKGKDVVNHIGHAIGHVFGRKRSTCPDCDKVNSKSSQTIVDNVCGSNFMTRQNEALTEINHMTEIYSSAINHTVIQKVEYDVSSLDVSTGQVQFKTVYLTYTLNGQTKRIRSEYPLSLTAIPKMGGNVGMSLYEGYV